LKHLKIFGSPLVGVGVLNSMEPFNIFFLHWGRTYVIKGLQIILANGLLRPESAPERWMLINEPCQRKSSSLSTG